MGERIRELFQGVQVALGQKRGRIALIAVVVVVAVLLVVLLISQNLMESTPTPTPTPTATPTLVRVDITDIVGPGGVILEDTEFTSIDGLAVLEITEGTTALTVEGGALEYVEVEVVCVGAPRPPGGGHMIGCAYDFGPDGTTFNPPLTMAIEYSPPLLPGGFGEENLVIAYFDTKSGKWVVLDSVLDPASHALGAQVSNFGLFAIFAFPILEYPEMGQWVETPKYMVNLISATKVPSYRYAGGYTRTADPGMVFIIIEATVVNTGAARLAISPGDFTVSDSEGRLYSHGSYSPSSDDRPYPSKELDLGQTAYGKIVFTVPEVATGLKVSSVLHGPPFVRAIWNLE